MRSLLLWVLALLITAASSVYQRVTGPTYPFRGCAVVAGQQVKFKLPRSHGGPGDAEIRLHVPDPGISGTLKFQCFRSYDAWTTQSMWREGESLVARLPHQPPAGKLEYKITLDAAGGDPVTLTPDPVVLRFRGDVPEVVLVLHVAGMVLAMLLSARAGLEALVRGPRTYPLAVWSAVSMVLGGLVLGAMVQKAAFGAYWTGWPLGQDLTDNKTLAAAILWLVAVWRTARNKTSRGWVLAACLCALVIWLIPHSVLGSELDCTPTRAPATR
jgi:hypothetical protein